jgi:hypothetical protein
MSRGFHKSSVLQSIRLGFWVIVLFGSHMNGDDIVYN